MADIRFVLFISGLILLGIPLCTGAEPAYVPGQVLVKFDPAGTGGNDSVSSLAESANQAIGAVTVLDYHMYGLDGLSLVALAPDMTVEEAVSYYSSIPGVAYAEPDYLLYADRVPDDPGLWRQWGLSNTGQVFRENRTPGIPGADIHALPAWDLMTGNHSSTVCVIDSGVDILHPDLHGNLWRDPLTGLHGYNIIRGEEFDVWDDNGHGTHCSGIIGMIGNNSIGGSGVNWNISLASIKVLDSGGSAKTSDLVLAILYTSMQDFPVISYSINGYTWSNATYEAILSSSSLLVNSAGNFHIDTNNDPVYPACYNLSNLIAVAATDSHDNLTDFSNFGNRTIHVGAPGQDIYSTFPSIYTYDPVWYAESGNLTPWNITGTCTIDNTDGYPRPPSIRIDKNPDDYELVTFEMNTPVSFGEEREGMELYLHYRVDDDTEKTEASITVLESYDKKTWNVVGDIFCMVNSGWKQGFIFLPDGGSSTYYRLETYLRTLDSPVHMHIGSVGVGTRRNVREPGYQFMNGTSMAAPFVSGMAAMIHQAAPDLTAHEIKTLIMETADPVPGLQGKIITGGRVNLSAALSRVVSDRNRYFNRESSVIPAMETSVTVATGDAVWSGHDLHDPHDPAGSGGEYEKGQARIPRVYQSSPVIPVHPA
jgi:subtilisin family serine protease